MFYFQLLSAFAALFTILVAVSKVYEKIFVDSNRRKSAAKLLKKHVWDTFYKNIINKLFDKLEYIDDRKSYVFTLISLCYTYILFNINWLIGGDGSISSIKVFPQEENLVIKIIYVIAPFAIVIGSYYLIKINAKLKPNARRLVEIVAIIASLVFWQIYSNNLLTTVILTVVAPLAPVLSLQTAIILILIKLTGSDFFTTFMLISIIASVMYSFLNISKYNECVLCRKARHIYDRVRIKTKNLSIVSKKVHIYILVFPIAPFIIYLVVNFEYINPAI